MRQKIGIFRERPRNTQIFPLPSEVIISQFVIMLLPIIRLESTPCRLVRILLGKIKAAHFVKKLPAVSGIVSFLNVLRNPATSFSLKQYKSTQRLQNYFLRIYLNIIAPSAGNFRIRYTSFQPNYSLIF